MEYGYDVFGWYIGTYPDGVRKRSTQLEPVNKSLSSVPGDSRSNWSGTEWVDIPYKHYDVPSKDVNNVQGMIVDSIRFQLLFTFAERLAIRAAESTDAGCKELLRMLDDPRLISVDMNLKSTQDSLDYLVSQAFITAERKAEILQGIIK